MAGALKTNFTVRICFSLDDTLPFFLDPKYRINAFQAYVPLQKLLEWFHNIKRSLSKHRLQYLRNFERIAYALVEISPLETTLIG